jgi:hypothetical protein
MENSSNMGSACNETP